MQVVHTVQLVSLFVQPVQQGIIARKNQQLLIFVRLVGIAHLVLLCAQYVLKVITALLVQENLINVK